jgi:hypothetical protein
VACTLCHNRDIGVMREKIKFLISKSTYSGDEEDDKNIVIHMLRSRGLCLFSQFMCASDEYRDNIPFLMINI